jgi:hypothetical protein
MSLLTDTNQQLEWAQVMRTHGEADQEFRLREIARDACERFDANDHRFPSQQAVPFMMGATASYTMGPAPFVSDFKTYTINVHPAIDGKERIIIAEAQLREQLEVEDL